jgi:hypothetical protein
MVENKSSVSKKTSYKAIGEYWDTHDLSEAGTELPGVDFEVDLQSDVHYYALDDSISKKVNLIAKKRGVSSETLVNLWLQERANKELAKS